MVKTKIIDGKTIGSKIIADLKLSLDRIDKKITVLPKLAIILAGENDASRIYIENKIKAAEKVGIKTRLITFSSEVREPKLLEQINILNSDKSVSGIIVQLPLPEQIDKSKVIKAIAPEKDVDGFHPVNIGLLFSPFENGFIPCTAMGCFVLIKSEIPDLSGKNVVVIGRSNIVGRPLAALLLKENCTVTICHSATTNIKKHTQPADIVISAVGKPKFLNKEYFRKGSMVIDVGINRLMKDNKYNLVGDVDFKSVLDHVGYITPVPGGVGPMTVAYLLVNTYKAFLKQNNIDEFEINTGS